MTVSQHDANAVCVADVIGVIEQMAPLSLAEEWDNCGLQVGSRRWPVQKIWVALDPLESVMEAAVHNHVDMVITHHPLLFRPLHSLDVETPLGRILQLVIASRIAVYSAHTNLDSVQNGVNDILARRIGLTQLEPLVPNRRLDSGNAKAGLGRLGILAAPLSLEQLALELKTALGLKVVKLAGACSTAVEHIALCSGGGSGLLDAFLSSGAQVYVSGDLRYHDARTVQDAGRAMIDVGHFPSEHIMIDALTEQLRDVVKTARWSVTVEPCRLEKDPFIYL